MDQISETNPGLTFYSAVTYEEAVNLLEECKPKVVLLDLNFHENKVADLLKIIKQSDCKTVIIVWYNHASDYSLNLCNELGADYLFDKYHEFEKIPGIISSLWQN